MIDFRRLRRHSAWPPINLGAPQMFNNLTPSIMSNINTTTAPTPETTSVPTQDKELQLITTQLQLATARSQAEYNASPAGQIQRQFEAMQRVAKPYAESTIVPKSYRGNIGNCVIALDLAYRMNLPALMVMKELYVVNGTPSWSSKFLIACINKLGRYTTIRYDKRDLGKMGTIKVQKTTWKTDAKGERVKEVKLVDTDEFKDVDNWECIAYCYEKANGELLESDPVSIKMAIQEGWYTNDGSKWVTMPQLMLSYRAAAFWQRKYAPEVSMGFPTREEVEDVQEVEYEDITNLRVTSASDNAPAAAKPKTKPTAASVEDAKQRLRDKAAEAKPAASNQSAARSSNMFDMP